MSDDKAEQIAGRCISKRHLTIIPSHQEYNHLFHVDMIGSPITCTFYRLAGVLLCCTAIFTIILTVRYFCQRLVRYQQGLSLLRLSPILIGMLISLVLISCTGIPLVLIQCFTCRPLRPNPIICKINAFICFSVGTFHMYMLALLSIFRYVNIIHKNSSFNRWLENHRAVSVLTCAIVSLAWSVPPLFDLGNAYTTEGIGFHCSLDWNNSAFHSRLFVYSLLLCNYFLILFMLIYSNLRVYFVLRHLLKINRQLSAALIPTILRLSIANINSASCVIVKSNLESELRKRISDRQIRRKLGRLERLKVDRRYARITAIMVTQFVIAWTPYAILATVIITGHIEWAREYQILAAVSELLAKFSLILNPLILIFTSQMRQY